jgi:hypothetical protein
MNKFFKWAGLLFFVAIATELVLYILGKYTPSNFSIGTYMFITAISFLEMFMEYRKNNK